MKIPVPTALAAVVVVASCAATVVALYGDGWFQEIEPAIEQTAVTKVEPSESEASAQIIAVEKLEIDLQGQRVLLPGDGWISAAEFWDIYYNHPQKLPGEIDFEMLQKLENLTVPERAQAEGTEETPQLPVGSDDPALDPALDPTLDPA